MATARRSAAAVLFVFVAGCASATTPPRSSAVAAPSPAPSLTSASAAECARERGLTSPGSTTATTITFTNARTAPVRIYWLDFNGQRVLYLTLAPQSSAPQKTFVGHIWVATDEQGNCLQVHTASEAPATVTIGR